jgi:hypothetical protein
LAVSRHRCTGAAMRAASACKGDGGRACDNTGDEVYYACWNESTQVQAFMKAKGFGQVGCCPCKKSVENPGWRTPRRQLTAATPAAVGRTSTSCSSITTSAS